MSHFDPPHGYARIRTVQSFHELVTTRFDDGVNALCWPRALRGDFREVVALVDPGEGIATLDDAQLLRLSVSEAGRVAVATLIEDQRILRAHGLSPVLDCIRTYPRDEPSEVIPTDVYSFHADSATAAADTWLCTYFGAASEGLRNDEALRRVDNPETRAELLRNFGGADNDAFREYLNENCFDLHYAPVAHARPFSFGLGNLWRIAVEYPGCPVPPCIHRAPEARGQSARLLLIS